MRVKILRDGRQARDHEPQRERGIREFFRHFQGTFHDLCPPRREPGSHRLAAIVNPLGRIERDTGQDQLHAFWQRRTHLRRLPRKVVNQRGVSIPEERHGFDLPHLQAIRQRRNQLPGIQRGGDPAQANGKDPGLGQRKGFKFALRDDERRARRFLVLRDVELRARILG